MTLREEVLKHSGLLTEEILEEGFFKKALTIAAVIAALAGAAIVGPKVGKGIKQYNSVKNIPVATRYEKVNDEMQKDIQNKEYRLTSQIVQKLKYVKDFHVEYNDRNNQAIIYFTIPARAYGYPSLIESDLNHLLDDYLEYIGNQSSKIEDRISPDKFNKTPLKVVITREIPEGVFSTSNDTDTIRKIVNKKLGTDAIDWEREYVD